MNTQPPVTCRHCGTENRPTRLFCSNCGGYLQAEAEDTWVQPPQRGPGSPMDVAAGRAPATRVPSPRAKPPARRRSRAYGLVLLVMLLVVAAALGALVYATLFSPGANGGGGPVGRSTSTTGPAETSATDATPGSTTSSSSPETTIARGPSLSPTSVKASSSLPSEGGNTYGPDNLFDGSLSTAWQENAPGGGEGEWVRFDFGREVTVSTLEIANGYQKDSARFTGNARVETLQLEYSDGTTQQLRLYDDTGFQEVATQARPTKWLRLTILSVYAGGTWDDAALSEAHIYQSAP